MTEKGAAWIRVFRRADEATRAGTRREGPGGDTRYAVLMELEMLWLVAEGHSNREEASNSGLRAAALAARPGLRGAFSGRRAVLAFCPATWGP